MPKKVQIVVFPSIGDLGVKHPNSEKVERVPEGTNRRFYLRTPFGTRVEGNRESLKNLQAAIGGEIVYVSPLRKSSRLAEKKLVNSSS